MMLITARSSNYSGLIDKTFVCQKVGNKAYGNSVKYLGIRVMWHVSLSSPMSRTIFLLPLEKRTIIDGAP